jgi:hypothetical protein
MVKADQTRINARTKAGLYGQLTRRYLHGTLPRKGSINALQFSLETASATQAAYGTSDEIELVELVRVGEGSYRV